MAEKYPKKAARSGNYESLQLPVRPPVAPVPVYETLVLNQAGGPPDLGVAPPLPPKQDR